MRWLVFTITTLWLLCLPIKGLADLATVYVATSGDDGFLSQTHASYSTSCDPNTNKDGYWTTSQNWVGDAEIAGAYRSDKSLLRFDLRGLNGTVNACTLYIYCHTKNVSASDMYVSRVNGNPGWWPWANTEAYKWGIAPDFTSSTLLSIEPVDSMAVGQWSSIVLDAAEIYAGRYLEIRLEDEYQRTCETPPGAGVDRHTRWYTKDNGGVGDDTYTPYVVLDYDPSEINCYEIYVPSGGADGYLIDSAPPMCDAANEAYTAQATMVCGEKSIGPYADQAYIQFNIGAVPAAEYASMVAGESAWLTLTVNAKGAIDFGNLRLWFLDGTLSGGTLTIDDWDTDGDIIRKYPYGDLTPGQQIAFDVTGYLASAIPKPAGPIMPFKFTNTFFCDAIPPFGDETCALRTSEYAGTASDPIITICTFAVPEQVIRARASTGEGHADASGLGLARSGQK